MDFLFRDLDRVVMLLWHDCQWVGYQEGARTRPVSLKKKWCLSRSACLLFRSKSQMNGDDTADRQ